MIVAVIPARSGSKAIVDKNIQLLGDKPLLAWTIELCLECPSIERVIVSTDSQTYADIGLQYGASALPSTFYYFRGWFIRFRICPTSSVLFG